MLTADSLKKKKKKKKVTQENRDNPEYKEKYLYLEIQEDKTSIKQKQDTVWKRNREQELFCRD